MRFFSARLNFDNGIVLKFDGFVVNLFQYKTRHGEAEVRLNSLFTKAGPDKTEAGPGVTTRRVVSPKPGLVYHEPGGGERSVDAEGYLRG